MADNSSLHLAVVGGGPGGYAAAFLAADLGLKVTLIDPELNPGGVCLYRGCIPSKALLHVAKLIEESHQAKNWGIEFNDPKIDLAKLRTWKESVVQRLTGGLGQLSKQRKVQYVQGRAAFEDSTTLRVTKADGSAESMHFDRVLLATGSRPAIIPALKIDSPRMMDSTGALDLKDIPKTLLVVGGGYIGLELGSVYAALGTRVTVVEMLSGLLPGADRDLVLPLHKRLEKMFDGILLNTTVKSLKEESGGIRATFEGADVKEREKVFDKVLVSVGRKPNSEIPGLDKTKVKVSPKGTPQSTRSATWSANRCWPTKRRTKGVPPWKPSPGTKSPSNRTRFPRSYSRIPKSHGRDSPKRRRRNLAAKLPSRSFPGALPDAPSRSTVPKA